MRIGFDAKRAFNNQTGLGNYSRSLIQALMQDSNDTFFLYTPRIAEGLDRWVKASEQTHLVLPGHPIARKLPALWRTYSLAGRMIEDQLDVFHGLSNELPVGIERFAGKKVVTIHDLIFLRYPDYYNNIDRYIYKKKFEYACKVADVIIAASGQTQKDIVHYFGTDPEKIVVIYQDCALRFRETPNPSQVHEVRSVYDLPEMYMLSVGTIESRKQQLTLLKAFHQAVPEPFSLLLVGKETPYVNEIREYIAQHNLQARVRILSAVKPDHLPVIYRCARMMIYPSEFEGFGIPVLEAMRSGVPVVLANASSLPEVGGNAAAYFPAGDVNALAAILASLPNDQDRITQMVLDGYTQASRFNFEHSIRQLREVYQSPPLSR